MSLSAAKRIEVHSGASPDEINELVHHMRAADRAECLAAGTHDVRRAVHEGVERSVLVWCALVDGRVACIFGVAALGLLADEALVWALGTDLVTANGGAFMRRAPPYIDLMLRAYPVIKNHVHAHNTVAIAWLKRAGFELGAAVPASTGELFYPFQKKRGPVCAAPD